MYRLYFTFMTLHFTNAHEEYNSKVNSIGTIYWKYLELLFLIAHKNYIQILYKI